MWYSEELYSKSNLFFYFNVFTFTAYHISPNKSALPNSNSPLKKKPLNHDKLMNISWLKSQYLKNLINISYNFINISTK